MDLDRNPFIVSARGDELEGRTQHVTCGDLLVPGEDRSTHDLALGETHTVTATFLALWNNLSLAHESHTSRATLLSVMHGITIEPRHPAYRVSGTEDPTIFQSRVGDHTALVFRRDTSTIVWLAVLRVP